MPIEIHELRIATPGPEGGACFTVSLPANPATTTVALPAVPV